MCLALLLCLAVCLTVQFKTLACVPCCPVYLAGWVTLQLEMLGCVWLLLESLDDTGCVPHTAS